VKRDLTEKDFVVLDFLSKLGGVARKKQLQKLIKSNSRVIHRLVENREVIEKDGVIQRPMLSMDKQAARNMLKVLDVVTGLYLADKITVDIMGMDEPFYIMAKSKKANQYIYFAFVSEGNEIADCQLIDAYNYGNVMVILENRKQIDIITLNTKVSQILYYEDYKV
jgi:hypothetical protein